jgi:hypothetical protein
VVMAITHRNHPVMGVQFHPESILTHGGYELLANFLRLAGIPVSSSLPSYASEAPPEVPAVASLPQNPVTF